VKSTMVSSPFGKKGSRPSWFLPTDSQRIPRLRMELRPLGDGHRPRPYLVAGPIRPGTHQLVHRLPLGRTGVRAVGYRLQPASSAAPRRVIAPAHLGPLGQPRSDTRPPNSTHADNRSLPRSPGTSAPPARPPSHNPHHRRRRHVHNKKHVAPQKIPSDRSREQRLCRGWR